MERNVMEWLVLLLTAFLFGWSSVNFLTIHPLKMNIHLSLMWIFIFFGLAVFVLSAILNRAWLGLFGWGTFFLLGYTLQARNVLSRQDTRPLPQLTRSKEDPGDGHTAVIYFTHGEPELYDPIGWINQFREFDECGISFVPFLARPFFLYQLRKKYLQVGMSHHREMHQRMLQSLENEFRQQGDSTTRFYLSFLDDNPRPDAAVIQALNDGASRLIVAEVFVSISNHTLEGKQLIGELPLDEIGIPILYTGPLWDSSTLHRMFVQRAQANLGDTDQAKVGILLVGHGQPDEWDKEFATCTEQELQFRASIIELFVQDGYLRENAGLAWMEFKYPKPAEILERFVRNGVERVIYYSAAISADSIHSQYDIPHLVSKSRLPKGFPIINLGAWNDDPLVIQAIKEKIDAVRVAMIQSESVIPSSLETQK